jgi:Predicted membrane protein/domain
MPIYKYAGFWRRLVAYLIDSTIITIVFFVLFMIAMMAFLLGSMSGNSSKWLADLMDPTRVSSILIFTWIFYAAMTIAYFTYFHGTTGRTPGKMLLGLQVLSADGTPISFGIAFLRAVGYLISGALFNIGFIWAAFDKRKQGWHDKIAGTVVIIREQESTTAGISIPDQPAVLPEQQNYGRQAEMFKGQSNQLDKIPENNS